MTVLDLEVRSNRATFNSAETKSVPGDRLETFVRTKLDVERGLLFEELRTAACGRDEMQQPHEVATPRLEIRHRKSKVKLALYGR